MSRGRPRVFPADGRLFRQGRGALAPRFLKAVGCRGGHLTLRLLSPPLCTCFAYFPTGESRPLSGGSRHGGELEERQTLEAESKHKLPRFTIFRHSGGKTLLLLYFFHLFRRETNVFPLFTTNPRAIPQTKAPILPYISITQKYPRATGQRPSSACRPAGKPRPGPGGPGSAEPARRRNPQPLWNAAAIE